MHNMYQIGLLRDEYSHEILTLKINSGARKISAQMKVGYYWYLNTNCMQCSLWIQMMY